jgi:cytochrome P450
MAQTEPRADYPSVERSECPWPTMRNLRESAPVTEMEGHPGVYLVSRYEDVKYVFSRPDLFSNEARSWLNGKRGLTTAYHVTETDPPDHKRRREITISPLKPGRLASYEEMIVEQADRLIDSFAGDGHCEFVDQFASWLPVRVMSRIVGVPEADEDMIRSWMPFEQSGLFLLDDETREKQKKLSATVPAYLSDFVRGKAEEPGDDAASIVIAEQIKRDGEFKFEEVLAQTTSLLRGGLFTTAHLLTTIMFHLVDNPDQRQAIEEDPRLIVRAIEESLRMEGPAMWQPRRVVTDTEVGGVPLAKDTLMIVLSASANHDGEHFEDPDSFDVFRANVKDHVAFGYGIHFCLGAPLARLEIRLAFERLLARLRNLRFEGDNDFAHIPSPQFRGLRRLSIGFDPEVVK